MDIIRNSVLLPDELFCAFSRCLGYQQNLNAAATTVDPCRAALPETCPSSDEDSYDPCPTVNRFSMPQYRPTLNGSRQNGSLVTEKVIVPSCNKVDDYQCCNLPECPNNTLPAMSANDQTLPQQINPLDSLYQFQSQIAPFQQFQRGSPYPERYVMDFSSRNNNSCDYEDTSEVGMNYGEFQRRQKLLQKIQQQLAQQHNQSNKSFLESDEAIVFEPDLNSTMINQSDCHQRSVANCQMQAPRHQRISNCQVSSSSCKPQILSRSTCDQTPETLRRQTQCESPPIQGRQMQYETEINNTSYMLPPETLRNARYCRQPNQNLSQNQCQKSQEAYHDGSINWAPRCQESMGQSKTSGCCNQRSTPCERSMEVCRENTAASRNHTSMDMSRTMSERSCLNQTSLDKTNRNCSLGGRSMRGPIRTPEDRLAERIQDEFHETLVKDRFCPGIIQDSLNGRENFNQYAREIAFAGPIPSKPLPVDPITMIEAIKLRIDYERKEIRKVRAQVEERESELKHQSRDGKLWRPRPIIPEDIDQHFCNKNKSEVNEGVAAFLKAEAEFRSTNLGADSAFDAHINSFESNLFDEKIKINSYTATTTPAYR
ncbi:uncharacterized protein LOC108135621 isoform X2 [Drosophila elegans]|uniref:uncharacterized protein LOC108135621 isoform X2 n=1 Tax=Drosophila elegans TaxID=30023 RepID=UPI001BC8479F|nr:uncharacterized protein LOC108135621 isoform X2 [Drosophila elegans]